MRWALAIALVPAVAGVARADGDDALHCDAVAMPATPPAKLERSMSDQIADRLTWLGQQMDLHLGTLSLGELDFHFDGRARRARIRIGKGDGGMLSMKLAGDIHFDHGMARVKTNLDLAVDGHRMHLALPSVELVPQSYEGETYLMVRLPILQGAFEPERWLSGRL